MAKDKKRGFFSWLGFGQKEEEQQQPEPSVEQTENQAVETPAEPVAAPLDDKLPAQESEPAASVDTPGEWDGSLTGEHIAESVPVVAEHSTPAQALAEEVVTLTEQVAAQQQQVIEAVAEPVAIMVPEPAVEPEPIASAPAVEPEPIVEPEPEVVETASEPEPEPEPLPANVVLEPVIIAPAAVEIIEEQEPESTEADLPARR
ncbi:Cell division protein FtsY [Serratia plymuthica]|uniref:Cell division protein FtsY n=1 Tax=Serratia plymuthica TaxID=82996 RepID=A0A2X4U5F7_SERPL|nr:Cell division protein FtsY [Serratia plymuthica]